MFIFIKFVQKSQHFHKSQYSHTTTTTTTTNNKS